MFAHTTFPSMGKGRRLDGAATTPVLAVLFVGFRLFISASAAEYKFYVNGTFGSVTSQNYPHLYPLNTEFSSNCNSGGDYRNWIITSPDPNSRIILNFEDLYLGTWSGGVCSYIDSISVRDGSEPNSPSFGSYSRKELPAITFVSTGNQMMLRFFIRTYSPYTYDPNARGFLTTYESITSTEYLQSPEGVVQSPNFPNPYSPSETTLTVVNQTSDNEPFNLIRLEFHAIDTEECCDTIKVYDGGSLNSRLVANYSGRLGGPFPTIVSNSRLLSVLFKSDATITFYGFDATYYPGTRHTFSGLSGSFANFGYPGYPNMLTEQWLITLPDSSKRVALSIKDIHTEPGKDILKIFDGVSNVAALLGEFSGTVTEPPYFISSTRSLLIQFTSDGSGEGFRGFAVNYNAVANTTTTTKRHADGMLSGPALNN